MRHNQLTLGERCQSQLGKQLLPGTHVHTGIHRLHIGKLRHTYRLSHRPHVSSHTGLQKDTYRAAKLRQRLWSLASMSCLYRTYTKVALNQKYLCNRFHHCLHLGPLDIHCQPFLFPQSHHLYQISSITHLGPCWIFISAMLSAHKLAHGDLCSQQDIIQDCTKNHMNYLGLFQYNIECHITMKYMMQFPRKVPKMYL